MEEINDSGSMGLASKGNERPENNYGSREPEYSHPACTPLHASSIVAECLPGVATLELRKELIGHRKTIHLQNIQRFLKACWASSLTV